jgi:predicted nucleic acid-binding protein
MIEEVRGTHPTLALVNQLKKRLRKGESEAIVLGIELQTDYLILLNTFAIGK